MNAGGHVDQGKVVEESKMEQEEKGKALIRLSIACNYCSRSIATLPKLKSQTTGGLADKKPVSSSVKEDVMRKEKGSSSLTPDPITSSTSIESTPRRPVDVPCRCRKPRARCSLCLSRLNTPSTHNLFRSKSELEAFGAIKISSYDTSLITEKSDPVIVKNPLASFTVFCATCRHSGHASHYLDWFQTNNHCPVSGCTCQCSSLDKMVRR